MDGVVGISSDSGWLEVFEVLLNSGGLKHFSVHFGSSGRRFQGDVMDHHGRWRSGIAKRRFARYLDRFLEHTALLIADVPALRIYIYIYIVAQGRFSLYIVSEG